MTAEAAIIVGDMRATLADMPADSVDAVVTDCPYEIGFMGRKWDSTGIAFDPATWAAVFRVLKPGAHLLAFGGTRTVHRIACAIEDAGFDIRDQIAWIYGTGFPKSLDVSKSIDKAAGAEREVVGIKRHARDGDVSRQAWATAPTSGQPYVGRTTVGAGLETAPATEAAQRWQGWGTALKPAMEPIVVARKPLIGTVAANVQEYGTGALNVDGCRIGIDAAERDIIDSRSGAGYGTGITVGANQGRDDGERFTSHAAGRWPANVILDPEAARLLDLQAGDDVSRFFYVAKPDKTQRDCGLDKVETVFVSSSLSNDGGETWESEDQEATLLVDTERSPPQVIGASGTPDRDATSWSMWLFGKPKTDRSRTGTASTTSTATPSTTTSPTFNWLTRSLTSGFIPGANCETMGGGSLAASVDPSTTSITITSDGTGSVLGADSAASITRWRISVGGTPGSGNMTDRKEGSAGLESPRTGAGRTAGSKNRHPTLKPVDLMRYLCRLVTPPGGIVLDPFAGSGTTGIAAVLEGFSFVGIELREEAANIARLRIAAAERGELYVDRDDRVAHREPADPAQVSIFDLLNPEAQ